MRLLRINKRAFKFQNANADPEPIRDVHGDLTGEFTEGFGPVIASTANIAPSTGYVNRAYFGSDIQYDRVIALDKDLGIDERSRLWIDDLTAERHDYAVKRVSKSINGVLIAASKVTNRA